MKTRVTTACTAMVVLIAAGAWAQSPKAATYITDDQVKAVNATPGVDRQLVSLDIGKLNEAIGVIHRGPTTTPANAAAGRGAAGGGGGGAAAPAGEPCGDKAATSPPAGTASGISHDHQT